MKIYLIAVGTKMPSWVTEGFNEYQKRFPKDNALELIEIPAEHRGKNANFAKILRKEGENTIAAIPKNSHVVTLDIPGKMYTTEELAEEMKKWRMSGKDVALLVGGPEGLADECKALAKQSWSLSKLTMPHPLVRIVVAESLYRAWSLIANLPYHRE